MRRSATSRRPSVVAPLLALATGLLLTVPRTAGAREPLDLDGTSWRFPGATARTNARAKGIGSMKLQGGEDVAVDLLGGDAWSASVGSGLVLGGTLTRKNEFARRLVLALDGASAAALAALYADAIEAGAAQEGVDLEAALTVERSVMVLAVRYKRRTGTAVAKLKAKFVLAGTVVAATAGSVPGKARGTLRGTSLPIALGP